MNGKNKEVEVFVGSGNVYKDIGSAHPEEDLAKSELARQIYKVIKKRKLTQKQAAELMGIDQPKVSDIIRGKLSKYSLDRLMRFLRKLGRDIEIRVKKHTKKSEPTWLHVVEDHSSGPTKRRATV